MGYYIKQRDSHFIIKKGNIPKAFKALKALSKQTHRGSGGTYFQGQSTPSFAWVDTNKFQNAKSLKDALSEWRWEIEIDADTGDVDSIYFEGEKMGDDTILFDALAPCVEDGCYIEMSGEDGAIWQWAFRKGKMIEQGAVLDWDDKTGMIDKILERKELLPTLLGLHEGLDRLIEKRLKEK